MKLQPFKAEWLELPDDEVGKHLLDLWIAYQAERKGISSDAVPREIEDKIVTATLGLDSLNLKNISKAISLLWHDWISPILAGFLMWFLFLVIYGWVSN